MLTTQHQTSHHSVQGSETKRDWPPQSGGMAALIRTHDWENTPLGTVAGWPIQLCTAVEMALDSAFATFVWWGPHLIQIYNDAAIEILRAKHPDGLGQPIRESWAEIWGVVGPLFERVLASGSPEVGVDLEVTPDRGGPPEPAWFTFCYSALRDGSGAIAGVQAVAIETTDKVRAEASRRESDRRLQEITGAAGLSADFRALFEVAPVPILVVSPPDFTCIAVNDAYLAATDINRDEMIGRPLFDVLPTNPADPTATGAANLRRSLLQVVATGQTDIMGFQQYDIPRRDDAVGGFEERWWSPINSPVPGPDGAVAAVVIRFGDVTETVHLRRQSEATSQLVRDQQEDVTRLREANEFIARISDQLAESEERQAFLVDLSDALRPLEDVLEIQEVATRMLGEYLQVDCAFYGELEGDECVILRDYHRPGVASAVGNVPIPATGMQIELLRSGRRLAVANIATDTTIPEAEREKTLQSAARAYLVVPLIKNDNLIAVFGFYHRSPRPWPTDEIALIEEATERTWSAIERARAEAALRQSEAQLQLITNHTPALIGMIDRDYRYRFINDTTCRFYGLNRDEVLGQSMDDVLGERIMARLRPGIERAMQGETVRFDDVEPDKYGPGHHGITDENFIPWIGPDGSIEGVYFLAIDISERRRIEDALRQSEERLRRMVNVDVIGVIVLESEGTLIEANDAFLAISGYRREQIENQELHWRTLTPPEYVETTEAQMRQLEITGRIGPYEKEYVLADGTRAWMLIVGQSLGDGTFVKYCVDVSKRKRAEAALRESDARYRRLFESMEQGFALYEVIQDEAGQAIDLLIHEINPAFVRITGLTDAQGRRLSELVPEFDMEWVHAIAAVLEDGESRRIERRAHLSGRWFDLAVAVVEDSEAPRLAVLFSDITDRRNAEEALRVSEERFRTIVEQATEYAIFTTDAEGRIDTWSPGAAEVFGWSADEAIGQSIGITFTAQDRASGAVERELRQARDSGQAPDVRWHQRKDGSLVFIYGTTTVVREPNGEVRGYFKIGRDITEQYRGELTLRASEEQFRTVANLVPDLLWSNDPAGAAGWYNQRWLDYTGQTMDEVVGGDWLAAVHPDDREQSRSNFESAVAAGQSLVLEHRIKRADGEYHWFLVRAEPTRDPNGEITRWFGSATDIHEARNARGQLESRVAEATADLRTMARRLMTVQEDERRYLAMELHDEVGQMLTGLDLQLAALGHVDPDKLGEMRAMIQTMTDQVRQLSMDLRPATLDRYGLLTALSRHIERFQTQAGIQIDLRHQGLDGRFAPEIEIAAFRIVQEALTNIARHGQVDHAAIQLLAEGDTLLIVIRDNGVGFDPTVRSNNGGLSGMRERAELVDGTLTIDTSEGGGVLITAELPLHDSGQEANE